MDRAPSLSQRPAGIGTSAPPRCHQPGANRVGLVGAMSALSQKQTFRHVRFTPESGHWSARVECPLWADTVEKVVSDPPKRNNRIRTASYLNRNCVRGRDFESMLRIRGRKIVFQQYRPKVDIAALIRSLRRPRLLGLVKL